MSTDLKQKKNLHGLLLNWYRGNARGMPWRAPPGSERHPDPYHVWLSEIMLQQTTVTAVIPYFLKFVKRWPTVRNLAQAELDDVLTAWAGLGYYARARNLHACAKFVSENLKGKFPSGQDALMELPGVGPYTAAAIASIAFNQDAVAVDGNVERVIARFFAIEEPMPKSKPLLRERAAAFISGNSAPSDFTQAMMELGATVCTPKNPKCGGCPLARSCQGMKQGIAQDLPHRVREKEKPTRYGVAYWVERGDGAFLARKRPKKGLLGGMMEVPSSPWHTKKAAAQAPAEIKGLAWTPLSGKVFHTFTHFHLELDIVTARAKGKTQMADGLWVAQGDVENHAFPTVMRKIISLASQKLVKKGRVS